MLTFAKLLVEGVLLGSVVALLVVAWLLLSEHRERQRARTLSRLEREATGEAEPCVMHMVGDGRVCRTCGQGHEVNP